MVSRTFIALCFSIFVWTVSAGAASIAKVAGLDGNPTANGRPLSIGSDLQEHDKVVVGAGNVQLVFTDGTRMVVAGNSTLVIEKYLMKGGNTVSNFTVDALRGSFRFITGNSAKAAYNIKTANSTIGIRGTGFDFYVNRATGVFVIHGQVVLCRGGKCVVIAPGTGAIADPGNVHLMTPRDYARLLLRFILMRNQGALGAPFRFNPSSFHSQFGDSGGFGGSPGGNDHGGYGNGNGTGGTTGGGNRGGYTHGPNTGGGGQ